MNDQPSAAAPKAGVISTEQAARLLTISGERVRQLIKDGYIQRVDKGRVLLVAAVQGYIRFLREEDRRSSKSAAASRLVDIRSEEIQARMLERSDALVREAQQEALAIIDIYAGGLRADLIALGARVDVDIATRRKIEKEIDVAFGEAAKRAADTLARRGKTSRAVDARPGRKRSRVGKKSKVPAKRVNSRNA